jgi:ABC-type polysaccharide/polyol phosphate transport system ATPase subunit
MMDGGAQPREAWRSLLRIAGIEPKARLTEDDPLTQRAVTVPGHVLRDISVDIEQGSVTCLSGPSGCGKSVLLKILAGVIAPTSGRVEIYGDIARLLTSGDNVDPRMTAHENIQSSPLYRAAAVDVAERYQAEVVDFAELQGFEHGPLRT